MSRSPQQPPQRSFVGKYADDLGQLISQQIKPVYKAMGIQVPVKSCSLVHVLGYLHQASLVDLAKCLNQSHQLIKQKIPRLLELKIITHSKDPHDKRRTLYQLTDLGRQQAGILKQNPMEQIYQQLSEEVGADIQSVLMAAIEQLQQKDLYTRYNEHNEY
ncbi:MarR family winged helix-turn-helix transcriptional regulator [Marinicella sediminis]|uniref:MarR family winged helix-turn-helix transcriptional regulator n=1 Tax=Marinicella sediminis TaxID=1792834 RepID=A0ABV7JEA4_9GAMM|nr:hypothetical protein [Marinicella sediminis]